jgi:hypothetical protein
MAGYSGQSGLGIRGDHRKDVDTGYCVALKNRQSHAASRVPEQIPKHPAELRISSEEVCMSER